MIVTRYARSPTGALDINQARLALAAWSLARQDGGRFTLRIDDADPSPNSDSHRNANLQDLQWLGLDWDDSWRQADRLDSYAAAAAKLQQSGRLYPCFEGEEELAVKRELRFRQGQALIYDRAMLKLTQAQREAAEAGGKRPYWRLKLSDIEMTWHDLTLGRCKVKLPALSDPILIRADGTFLRSFTSVIDDLAAGTSHVIRDETALNISAVQMDLMIALGANPGAIAYAHLPALRAADGGKLGRAPSLRSLARDGVEPAAIRGYLLALGADSPTTQFDPSNASRQARFDIGELLALNRSLLGELDFAAIAPRLPPGATEAFWNAIRGHIDLLAEARGYWDVIAGTIIPPVMEGETAFLHTALDLLPAEPWGASVWQDWTAALAAATNRPEADLHAPLRLALTGEDHGPSLQSLLPLIGRTRTAQRLLTAAS